MAFMAFNFERNFHQRLEFIAMRYHDLQLVLFPVNTLA